MQGNDGPRHGGRPEPSVRSQCRQHESTALVNSTGAAWAVSLTRRRQSTHPVCDKGHTAQLIFGASTHRASWTDTEAKHTLNSAIGPHGPSSSTRRCHASMLRSAACAAEALPQTVVRPAAPVGKSSFPSLVHH
jgi:hypothetical protein